jgi:hypothetical protein
MLRHVVSQKSAEVSEALTTFIIRTLKATCMTETSASFFWTKKRIIREDIQLHSRCSENLKSHEKP